jgi:Mg2+-importing ATPase
MGKSAKPLDDFWDPSLQEIFQRLQATPAGLAADEAGRRLRLYGTNSLAPESRFALLISLLSFFSNPLVIILVAAASVSFALGEHVGAAIIIAIVLFSVLLNFLMEFQAHHAVDEIRKQIAITAIVIRDRQEQEVTVTDLVPGDVIRLKAGDLVPADARLLNARDLQVRESALTGESLPVEKTAIELAIKKRGIADASNSIFLGTSVQTGIGTAVVVRTGRDTACGEIARRLAKRPPETEFARGTRHFGVMLTRVTLLLVLFVLLVNIVFHRPVLESFLFAVALAVGMTPEMMPMIITVTLAQGATRMTRKKVLVKQLAAIEDFGSIDILCTDKTGTLTEGDIVLDRHVDCLGKPDEDVLRYIYLNSHFQAGIKSPLDDAILKHKPPCILGYDKVDEIPFDFNRRRLSVVVRNADDYLLITKGEAQSIFAICEAVIVDGVSQPFDDSRRAEAESTFRKLGADGYRALGVAVLSVEKKDVYTVVDEHAMTLAGFAAFLDPPKEGVFSALQTLKQNGISVVIMTGDNQYVTQKIAHDIGLDAELILVGSQIDTMDDAAVAYQAAKGAIFARMSPEQKNRVIIALKRRGHVVGYMGDGINDAPSLHTADVGISVMNGVNVAKDAAKIILLEKELTVVNDGILEGRRSFANIMKYIIMGPSSNFGNMFSMAAASLFLPFLPMLPSQILLNNLLYDVSQVTIPTDNVDSAMKRQPRRWQIGFIQQFMVIIGPISSIYDFLTFAVLLWVFHASTNETLFHTGWFVESLATQTLVVFVIRTAANPLKSRPSWPLLISVLAVVVIATVLPYTPLGRFFRFTPLPLSLLGAIALLAITYLILVQLVKSWFYRRHALL